MLKYFQEIKNNICPATISCAIETINAEPYIPIISHIIYCAIDTALPSTDTQKIQKIIRGFCSFSATNYIGKIYCSEYKITIKPNVKPNIVLTIFHFN